VLPLLLEFELSLEVLSAVLDEMLPLVEVTHLLIHLDLLMRILKGKSEVSLLLDAFDELVYSDFGFVLGHPSLDNEVLLLSLKVSLHS